MMRLIQVCLPLVLAPVLAAGQQTQPPTTQKPQTNTAQETSKASSQATAKRAIKHRAARARRIQNSLRKGQKRPEYTGNSVEMINGEERHRVALADLKPANSDSKKEQAPLKVQIVNGTAMDTRYFHDSGEAELDVAERNEPVVVAIESSDTRAVGGNKHPVVTGVTFLGTGDAKNAGNIGKPMTRQVWPRPKRPAYESDMR